MLIGKPFGRLPRIPAGFFRQAAAASIIAVALAKVRGVGNDLECESSSAQSARVVWFGALMTSITLMTLKALLISTTLKGL